MTRTNSMSEPSSAKLQLALGTGAFALCFAVFGSMSAMMPIISRHMALTPVQKSVAIAIPVLLGSLGRIPLGILTDRFGGRIVFSVVMVLAIIPAFLMGGVSSYGQLLSLWIPDRHRTCQLLGRRSLCEWMVSTGTPRLRSWRLWRREHWAIAGCLWFAGASRGGRIQMGLLDLRRTARRVARDLRQHGSQCSQSRDQPNRLPRSRSL